MPCPQRLVYPAAMDRPSKSRENAEDLKGARDERLAAALRENLKRRKAQARAKEGPAKEAAPEKAPSK